MKRKTIILALITLLVTAAKATTPWIPNTLGEGEFMIYNVGAQKFLNAGNAWGTQASVSDAGIFVSFAQSGEGYTLSTAATYGQNKFFGKDKNEVPYLDQGSLVWSFTEIAEATYTISDGTNYLVWDGGEVTTVSLSAEAPTDGKGYWQVVSRENLVACLSGATEQNPIDATFYLSDPDFSRAVTLNVWEFENVTYRTNITNKAVDNNKNFGCESWNRPFSATQTVTGLRPGYYEVSCSGFGTHETTYIFANDAQEPFVNTTPDTDENFVNALDKIEKQGYYAGNKVKVAVTNGELTFGVKREQNKNQDWAVFDAFRLTYYGIPIVYSEDEAISVVAGTTDVVLHRTLTEGFNTLVLPFSLTSEQVKEAFGAETKVYTLTGETLTGTDAYTLNFAEGEEIAANTPVILKDVTKAANTYMFSDVTIEVGTPTTLTEHFDFVGVYESTTVPEGAFFLKQASTELRRSTGTTAIKGLRAYIAPKEPVSTLSIALRGEGTTGIEDAEWTMDNSEALGSSKNGQLTIYDLQGRRVQKMEKGIYIVNGKKVIK